MCEVFTLQLSDEIIQTPLYAVLFLPGIGLLYHFQPIHIVFYSIST